MSAGAQCIRPHLDAAGSEVQVRGKLMFSASVSCSREKLREATVHTV